MTGKNKTHKILIVGGFHKARSLAVSLTAKGFKVTVVNRDYEACEKLAEISRLNVIYGDGSKMFILKDAGAGECDVAIALTDSDETNLIICELCKKCFHVRKTVALLNDPAKTNFFYQMGVDSVVCALNMITNIMEEQAVMNEMTRMVPIEEGKIHIAEIPILKGSEVAGRKLSQLNLPQEIIVGCIIRDDQSLIPRGETLVREGDILLVITSDQNKLKELKELNPNETQR